jgi:hypothetical protein
MFRNALIACFALVATAGTFGGTTTILSAGVTAPVTQVA